MINFLAKRVFELFHIQISEDVYNISLFELLIFKSLIINLLSYTSPVFGLIKLYFFELSNLLTELSEVIEIVRSEKVC